MHLSDHSHRLAYHESGHAIAALTLGCSVSSASIVATDRSLGRAIVYLPADPATRIVVSYAGPAAEQAQYGGFSFARYDLDDVQEDAARARLDAAHLSELWEDALALVRHEWPAIARLANLLLVAREVSGERIHEVFQKHGQVPHPRSGGPGSCGSGGAVAGFVGPRCPRPAHRLCRDRRHVAAN